MTRAAFPPSEIRSLTGLRGVAALYVLGYHLTRTLTPGYARSVFDHGYLAVDLFFVLSGFVMSLVYDNEFADGVSPRGYIRFVLKRLGRVYPVYLFATIGVILTVLILWSKSFGARMILANLLLVNEWGLAPSIDYPGWSISAEFAAYLLFPLAARHLGLGDRPLPWIAGVISIACLCWLASVTVIVPAAYATNELHLPGSLDFSWFGPYPIIRCLAEFTLGMVACRIVRRYPPIAHNTRHAGIVVTFAIALLLAGPRNDVAIALLFALLIGIVAKTPASPLSRGLSAAPIHWLGMISYSLYMMQAPVFAVLVPPMTQIWRRHPAPNVHAALCAAAVLPIVLVSALCHYGIEKPGRELSRKWLGARSLPIAVEPAAP